jgi:hypothetical protein
MTGAAGPRRRGRGACAALAALALAVAPTAGRAEAVALRGDYPTRDPQVTPFAPDSLWNTPIGDGARLAFVGHHRDLRDAQERGLLPPGEVALDRVGADLERFFPFRPLTGGGEPFALYDGDDGFSDPVPVGDLNRNLVQEPGEAWRPLGLAVASGARIHTSEGPTYNSGGAMITRLDAEGRPTLAATGRPVVVQGAPMERRSATWRDGRGRPFAVVGYTAPLVSGRTRYVSLFAGPSVALDPRDRLDESRLGAHGAGHMSAVGGVTPEMIDRIYDDGDLDAIDRPLHLVVPPNWLWFDDRLADRAARKRSSWVWPASTSDSGYDDPATGNYYSGSNPALRAGSLLCVSKEYRFLHGDPARSAGADVYLSSRYAVAVARALQVWGGYVLDTSGRSNRLRVADRRGRDVGRPRLNLLIGLEVRDDRSAIEEADARIGAELGGRHGVEASVSAGPSLHADFVAIVSRLSVVTNNAPDAVGGGGARPPGLERPPISWLGGVVLADGVPVSAERRAGLTLWKSDGAGGWTRVANDVFGRPVADRAHPEDAAAGAVMFPDLDEGVYQFRSGRARSDGIAVSWNAVAAAPIVLRDD